MKCIDCGEKVNSISDNVKAGIGDILCVLCILERVKPDYDNIKGIKSIRTDECGGY